MKKQKANKMATQELILRFYREPHLFKDLKNPVTPLPAGISEVLVSLHNATDKDDLDYLELREAMITFACGIFFLPRASAYRVLGLNNNAPPAEIDEHYLLLHDLFSENSSDPEYQRICKRLDDAYAKLSHGREPPSLEEVVASRHSGFDPDSDSAMQTETQASPSAESEQPFEADEEKSKPRRQTYSQDTFIGKVMAFYYGEGNPQEYAYLNAPLPKELTELCERAADSVATVSGGQEDDEADQDTEIRDAVTFFIKKALFIPGADHYRVLGLNPNASSELIQIHYRLLRRMFSADEEDAAVRNWVARISEAYVTLRDPVKRRNYDASLGRGRSPGSFQAENESVMSSVSANSTSAAKTPPSATAKTNAGRTSIKQSILNTKLNQTKRNSSESAQSASKKFHFTAPDNKSSVKTEAKRKPEFQVEPDSGRVHAESRRKVEPTLDFDSRETRIFPEVHATPTGSVAGGGVDRGSNNAGLKVVIGVVGVVIGVVIYFAGNREAGQGPVPTPLPEVPVVSAPPPAESPLPTDTLPELPVQPSEPASEGPTFNAEDNSNAPLQADPPPATGSEDAAVVTAPPAQDLSAPQPAEDMSVTPEVNTDVEDVAAQERENNIKQLLAKADKEYRSLQLTQPPGRNAAETYHDVLENDPSNEQARAGLKRIADRYLRMARQRQAEGNEIAGLEMVSKGLMVVPEHEGLLAMMEALGDDLASRDARDAARRAMEERRRVELEALAKREREQEISERLARESTQLPAAPPSSTTPAPATTPPQTNASSPDSATDNVAKIDNSAETASSLSDAELNALITRFVELYEAGDLNTFMGLFASNARANNRDSRATIRQDYQTLFEQTDTRLMMLRDLKWDKGNQRAIGEAEFELTIKRKGSDDNNVYSGSITFQVEKNGTTPLITGIYHSQRKLDQ